MPTNAPCASETWPRGHSGSASAGSGPEPPRRRRARSRRGGGSAAPSYGALLGAAEQALRPEQDDGDQEEQRDRGAVLGRDVGRGEIVDDAEEEPAGDRPRTWLKPPTMAAMNAACPSTSPEENLAR